MIVYHMLYVGHAYVIFVRLSSSVYLSYQVYSLSHTHIWVYFILSVDVGWNTATKRYTSSLIKCGVYTYRLYLSNFVYIRHIQCLYIFVISVKNISSHHINKIRILRNENILFVKLFRECWCWILKYTQMYCFYFQISKRRREICMTILKLR